MPSNKPRLYIALYERPITIHDPVVVDIDAEVTDAGLHKPGSSSPYNWALLLLPKDDTATHGTKFHVVPRRNRNRRRRQAAAAVEDDAADYHDQNEAVWVHEEEEGEEGEEVEEEEEEEDEEVWAYEEKYISLQPVDGRLLTRVLVGKVESARRLAEVLRSVKPPSSKYGSRSKAWVKDAVETMAGLKDSPSASAAGGSGAVLGWRGRVVGEMGWPEVERVCGWYTESKVAEGRFDGGAGFEGAVGRVPTWDLVAGKEIVR